MGVSIIVCTRNRGHLILQCLSSIATAIHHSPSPEVELLLVDNGSTDDTAHRVKTWAAQQPFPVILLNEPRAGLSIARNCGLRAARYDIIAFTDDDCRLSEHYFSGLIQHFQKDSSPVLRGGRVEPGDPLDLPMTIKTDNTPANYAPPMEPGGFIHGANMAMSRGVLKQVGFFDERFGAGTKLSSGEDTDYIIRAADACDWCNTFPM